MPQYTARRRGVEYSIKNLIVFAVLIGTLAVGVAVLVVPLLGGAAMDLLNQIGVVFEGKGSINDLSYEAVGSDEIKITTVVENNDVEPRCYDVWFYDSDGNKITEYKRTYAVLSGCVEIAPGSTQTFVFNSKEFLKDITAFSCEFTAKLKVKNGVLRTPTVDAATRAIDDGDTPEDC